MFERARLPAGVPNRFHPSPPRLFHVGNRVGLLLECFICRPPRRSKGRQDGFLPRRNTFSGVYLRERNGAFVRFVSGGVGSV